LRDHPAVRPGRYRKHEIKVRALLNGTVGTPAEAVYLSTNPNVPEKVVGACDQAKTVIAERARFVSSP